MFNKKTLRIFDFSDKLDILKCLPPADSHSLASQKSLHYLLLNDILTEEKDNWELFNKETVMMLVNKCMEMS